MKRTFKLPLLQPDVDLSIQRKPDWFKIKVPGGGEFPRLHKLFSSLDLHTVCESARCPNMAECWGHGTATFMILGDICTRSCGFCAVKTGKPEVLDLEEPKRVAEAVAQLDLQFVVITSVNRDELEDGGAPIFAETVKEIRKLCPGTGIELLIPDFMGNWSALDIVLESAPEVLNHNMETVPRLYPWMRPQAKFERSLELLERTASSDNEVITKSGMMVGAGETLEELHDSMKRVRDTGCNILTLGQYLRPSRNHHPVFRYYHPDEFAELKRTGLEMGYEHVESGPLVRSSYHAWEQVESVNQG